MPKEIVIEYAPWEQVRENQELYAREFDLWVQRQEPALAQRAANFTDETDRVLRKEIEKADLRSNLPLPELEGRVAELLNLHTDSYERGQILFKGAQELALANGDKEARAAIEEALKLPLWPDQRIELYRVKGQLILSEYRRNLGDSAWGEDAAFPEMRRAFAAEYLKGLRVALDCAFPADLPDLQLHNMLESRILPQDPVQRQAVLDAIAHRETVQAKSSKFLGLICRTESLRVRLEEQVVSKYAQKSRNPEELAALAAEILHDPQEEAKLMRMLKARG